MSEVDRKETQAASRAIKKARKEAEEARLLFDGASSFVSAGLI